MQVKDNIQSILVSVCLGNIAFWMVAGFRLLDPASLDAFQYSDNFQHHLSSVFFRSSPWVFPIGLNPQYGLIAESSIVYADSLPLMAIFLKLASPWFPATYQYLGIWTLMCFCLQAFFAWKLMGCIISDVVLRVLGSGFFIFLPFFLIRVGLHTALVSQFLILAALFFRLSLRHTNSGIYWIVLIVLSASIHFYIFFVVFVIWLTDLIDRFWSEHTLSITVACREFLLGTMAVLLVMWQLGYFVGDTAKILEGGFGFYQMNLLGPFDPQGWSYFFPSLTPQAPTIEGISYFGAGILMLVPLTFFKRSHVSYPYRDWISRHRFFLLALVCLFLLAISHRILLGKYLFEFSIPELFYALGGALRSSGRMFWPIGYLITFLLIALVIKKFPLKQAQWILAVALLVQIIDTSPGWLNVRSMTNERASLVRQYRFTHSFWDAIPHQYKKVISIIAHSDQGWNWIPAALFAAHHNLGTNSAYLSRIVPLENKPIQNDRYEYDFDRGRFDPHAIYIISRDKIFTAASKMNPENDLLAVVDGVIVLAPNYKKCSFCPKIPADMDLYLSYESVLFDRVLEFNRSSKFAYLPFLTQGWSYPEQWGTWSEQQSASMILPLPTSSKYTIFELKARALISPEHPAQKIKIMANGVLVKRDLLTKEEYNAIQIPIPKLDRQENFLKIDFEFENPVMPRMIGVGDDDRALAIGLISGKFK